MEEKKEEKKKKSGLNNNLLHLNIKTIDSQPLQSTFTLQEQSSKAINSPKTLHTFPYVSLGELR